MGAIKQVLYQISDRNPDPQNFEGGDDCQNVNLGAGSYWYEGIDSRNVEDAPNSWTYAVEFLNVSDAEWRPTKLPPAFRYLWKAASLGRTSLNISLASSTTISTRIHTFSRGAQEDERVVFCKICILEHRRVLRCIKHDVNRGTFLFQHINCGRNRIMSESLCC